MFRDYSYVSSKVLTGFYFFVFKLNLFSVCDGMLWWQTTFTSINLKHW